jgi:hypothetical protein
VQIQQGAAIAHESRVGDRSSQGAVSGGIHFREGALQRSAVLDRNGNRTGTRQFIRFERDAALGLRADRQQAGDECKASVMHELSWTENGAEV